MLIHKTHPNGDETEMNLFLKRWFTLFVLSIALSGSALSSGLQNSISTDLVGLAQLDPNLQFERRLSNLFSAGAGLSFDAQDFAAGLVLTPFVRYAPTGALREGVQLQVGGYFPTNDDLLFEGGAGYSIWVDRIQVTPMVFWRHDQSWRAQLQVGWGWF